MRTFRAFVLFEREVRTFGAFALSGLAAGELEVRTFRAHTRVGVFVTCDWWLCLAESSSSEILRFRYPASTYRIAYRNTLRMLSLLGRW